MTDQRHCIQMIQGISARYGLSECDLNQPVEYVLPVTVGLCDTSKPGELVELPLIELTDKIYSQIDVLNTPSGVLIVLRDAAIEADQRKHELQCVNTTAVPWPIVKALDMAVFEESADRSLTLLNQAPQWMDEQFSTHLMAELPQLATPGVVISKTNRTVQINRLTTHSAQLVLAQNVGEITRDGAALQLEHIRKLENMAFHDNLTSLYNRAGFLTSADPMLAQAQSLGTSLLIFAFDMDNLKTINDTYGHGAGDVALKATAAAMQQVFRSSDIVARLGGDEFAVLATCNTHYERRKILGRLDDQLALFNSDPNNDLPLSLSVGTTWFRPGDTRTLSQLMAAADIKMYRKKRAKKEKAITTK